MTENEKDYSDYIQYLSGGVSFVSLLGGFTFAAYTILLTELPNPSSITSQFILLLLAALFYLFMSLITWAQFFIASLCRNLPPAAKGANAYNLLLISSYVGLGTTIVLMPLLWDLTYLALATGIMWVIFLILSYRYITKPILEYLRKLRIPQNR